MLHSLFSTNGFMARMQCGVWADWLITLHVLGDGCIAVSYAIIPIVLLRALYLHKRGLLDMQRLEPYLRTLITMLCVFVGLCGFTHVDNVAVFWYPAYKLFGMVTAATGLASLSTAYAMLWALSYCKRRAQ